MKTELGHVQEDAKGIFNEKKEQACKQSMIDDNCSGTDKRVYGVTGRQKCTGVKPVSSKIPF